MARADTLQETYWRVKCVDSKGIHHGGILTANESIATAQYRNLVQLATSGHLDWRVVLEVRAEGASRFSPVQSYP